MWTTVYLATGFDIAVNIKNKLSKEGFLVKIKFFSKEGEEELYEILAPEFEVEDIQEAMVELGLL